MFRRHLSSMALSAMDGFSALHVRCRPSSSTSGLNEMILMTVILSSESCCNPKKNPIKTKQKETDDYKTGRNYREVKQVRFLFVLCIIYM